MFTLRPLAAPLFDLKAAAELLPDVDKKFIRNATDRELIPVRSIDGGRMYSSLNVIALDGLSTVANGGSSLTMAKFVGGILAHRAEDRARFDVLGTRQDMRWLVYALDVTRAQRTAADPRMQTRWVDASEIGNEARSLAANKFEVRLLPADELIEGFVERYRAAGGGLF